MQITIHLLAKIGNKGLGNRESLLDHNNTPRQWQNGRHLQATFFNTFSWKKCVAFCLNFHFSLFLRVKLTIYQHWFSNWHGPGGRQPTNNMQCTPYNMILLCFFLLLLHRQFWYIHAINVPIFFRFTQIARRQSQYWHNAYEVTLFEKKPAPIKYMTRLKTEDII